ncbi:hypothetical protein Tery_4961 [Trichodesmium erythraeum IMS101]|uniref:Sigma-70 family RNA polymerase sigma factor n=1 Tax=Trichodesmium erythraeum (strain IMS101) TaxID=203124 RepID=Q10V49_TRIEI|nr:hypothetical protein [Trichodesmium erythraeum GBRTRLIN201]
MVISKYVSLTQVYNEMADNDLLCGAIANFCGETPGSQEWHRAFDVLWTGILKSKILATSQHPKYPDLLQEIQLELSQRICQEFDPKRGKNFLHSLRLWINYRKNNYGLGLRYRILDLYQEYKQKAQREASLDAPIYGGNNDLNIPTLEDVIAGNFPEPMESLSQQDFGDKLSAEVQKLGCHPKKYPQCTCGEIARRNFFMDPPQIQKDIAEELKVPLGTLTAHWNRKCKPLLRKIYQELSGEK